MSDLVLLTYAINNQSAYGWIHRWLAFLCFVKNTSVQGAFSHSTASVMLDAMHSAVCAISTCWGAISLLYRREQNPDSPTHLIRFKYSQEPMVSVPLVLFKHPWQACVTPSTHLCVWFSPREHNHENHLSAVIHKNNCKPFPLPPSHQETIKSQKPRRT